MAEPYHSDPELQLPHKVEAVITVIISVDASVHTAVTGGVVVPAVFKTY